MKTPARLASNAEAHPVLPPGSCERVSGYGVMGLPFSSGHVLGLRRWTAASIGDAFTSIWHRDPAGCRPLSGASPVGRFVPARSSSTARRPTGSGSRPTPCTSGP